MKRKLHIVILSLVLIFALTGNAFAAPWTVNNGNYQNQGNASFNTSGNNNNINYNNNEQIINKNFFFDVQQNNWAYNVIKDMKNKGIISGDTDGKFYPNRIVTRAEFATMLTRAMHLSVSQDTYQMFTDVDQSFWAYKYIEAAAPYLTGYQNQDGQMYFSPHDPAVREDIIVAMVKAKHLDNQQPDLSVLSKFEDAASISDGLKGYVAIAVANNLVKGSVDKNGNYRLYPQGKLTRAEAAAFLDRIIQAEKIVVGNSQSVSQSVYGQ